jgi:hypothetical protein
MTPSLVEAYEPALLNSTLTIAPLKTPAILFAIQDARHQAERVIERIEPIGLPRWTPPTAPIVARNHMRLRLHCHGCLSGNPSIQTATILPMNDKGAYRYECARGHQQKIIVQHSHFEVLAEVAVQAIEDGYHRDAVSSFTASLERFYEFYIRVMNVLRGVKPEVGAATWKQVANQSERQFGMFLAIYQIERNATPPVLSDKQRSFRNKVIHQGAIPTELEAIDYGQAIIDLVQPLLTELYEHHGDETHQILHHDFLAARGNETHRDGWGYSVQPMVYFMGSVPFQIDLTELLGRRAARRY